MSKTDLQLAHLRELFALCEDMLCAVGADGTFELANPAFCEAVGHEPDALSTERFVDFVHEDDRSRVKAALAELAPSGGETTFAARCLAADGTARALEWRAQARASESTVYLLGTDVTKSRAERRSHREELRESELRAKALFDNASQGIITVDRTGRILSMNPMAEKLFGYTTQELVGDSVDLLLPEALRDLHARHREDYFVHPRARPMGLGLELLGRRKDGTEFPVEISLSAIRAKDGPVAVAFVNDITERHRSRSEKERLERRLEHATKMEAVGRLAGGIAHDFNNLLTALSGFSEIVLDELPEDHPLHEGAKETFKTCQRSQSLVRQLLAVSRRQMLTPHVIDLNAKISEIEKMLRSVLGEDIDLVVKLSPRIGAVQADESQIEQVVLNLVVNARDAMPTGGRLVIQTANVELDETFLEPQVEGEPGPHVLLSVSDTGHGMDADTLEHMFEPFFTTKERGKGTGLGLSTVYGIVNQSGGHIWAYSEPGKGTTFKVYLPRVRESSETRGGPETGSDDEEGSETVLVVEDENTVRLVVVSALKKAGYHVLAARDGEEALRVAEACDTPIHLVVTDVVMPRINGPELVSRLSGKYPKAKTLYISGHADDALVHHGILEESLAFLEKPFTRADLLSKVRELLDQ